MGASGYRPHLPSTRFLQHCLAVAETHVEILATAVADNLSATISVEVKGWQNFTGQGGEQLLLKPDITAQLFGNDEEGPYADYWFIEVDCGTESIPALLRKCQQYRMYHASGMWASTFGVMPRVLFVMSSNNRVASLKAALQRQRDSTTDLFRATTLDLLHNELKGGDL